MEIMTIDESGKYDMKFYIPIIVNWIRDRKNDENYKKKVLIEI
jgi:hypothetical protein